MLWLPTTTIFKANDAFKVAMFRFFKNRLQQMGLQNYQTPHKLLDFMSLKPNKLNILSFYNVIGRSVIWCNEQEIQSLI